MLPNERAIEPQITAIYRRFGLNDRQIEILARATPKRDYYCQSRRGNRLFELGLSEVGLALCAASSKSDQTEIARIHAEHGWDAHDTDGSNLRWLVDGKPFAKGNTSQRTIWPGRHLVQITDAKGQVLDQVRFEVRGAGVAPGAVPGTASKPR